MVMPSRELTESEKKQRRKLNERFKGRASPRIDSLDIGLPAFDETVNVIVSDSGTPKRDNGEIPEIPR